MAEWIVFWLDTLTFYGPINSKEEWQKVVKEKFGGSIRKLRQLKSNSLSELPDFGEGAKYTVLPTLGQWADDNEMDLTV